MWRSERRWICSRSWRSSAFPSSDRAAARPYRRFGRYGRGAPRPACCVRARHPTPGLLYSLRIETLVKRVRTTERDAERLVSIARRVCWWRSADATLENTPLFLCQVMEFGTWADICFVLDHHGKVVFREALRSAPPGLFDNRSWHYWHHRLHLLPVPPPPRRTIPA